MVVVRFFMFTGGEMIPNLTIEYFSNGLVPPPTRVYWILLFFFALFGHEVMKDSLKLNNNEEK